MGPPLSREIICLHESERKGKPLEVLRAEDEDYPDF
jgi:hypothetical protein